MACCKQRWRRMLALLRSMPGIPGAGRKEWGGGGIFSQRNAFRVAQALEAGRGQRGELWCAPWALGEPKQILERPRGPLLDLCTRYCAQRLREGPLLALVDGSSPRALALS